MENNVKKYNKEKIKKNRKLLKSEIFDVSNELAFNENDEAIIECKIGQPNNVFNKYDIMKDRTVSNEFNDFLLEETEIIPMQYNLEVKLHVSENLKEDEQNQIRKALKRHFSFNITKDKVKIKRNAIVASIMYILGFIALFLTPFAYELTTKFPLYESLLILTWFLIWEASDLVIFDRSKLRMHRYNLFRLYTAKITFVKEKELLNKTTVIVDKATIITDKSTVYASSSNTKEKNQKTDLNIKKEVKEIKNIVKNEEKPEKQPKNTKNSTKNNKTRKK